MCEGDGAGKIYTGFKFKVDDVLDWREGDLGLADLLRTAEAKLGHTRSWSRRCQQYRKCEGGPDVTVWLHTYDAEKRKIAGNESNYGAYRAHSNRESNTHHIPGRGCTSNCAIVSRFAMPCRPHGVLPAGTNRRCALHGSAHTYGAGSTRLQGYPTVGVYNAKASPELIINREIICAPRNYEDLHRAIFNMFPLP